MELDTNLSIRMRRLAKVSEVSEEIECPECVVVIDGLFWQDSDTGEFDIASDITEYVE